MISVDDKVGQREQRGDIGGAGGAEEGYRRAGGVEEGYRRAENA